MKQRLLWTILTAGLLVRLWAAWFEPIYIDEGFVYYTTSKSVSELLAILCATDSQLPLYNILMHYMRMICDSLFLMRLPSVLAGTASLWFIWHIGEEIGSRLQQKHLGSLAAGFVALCFPVWISDLQTRCYALLTLCLLWGIWLMLRWGLAAPSAPADASLTNADTLPADSRDVPSIATASRPALGLILAAFLLTANLHYLGTVAVASLAASALLTSRPWKERLALLASGFLACLPALGWFLYTTYSAQGFFVNRTIGRLNPGEAFNVPCYLSGLSVFNRAYYTLASPASATHLSTMHKLYLSSLIWLDAHAWLLNLLLWTVCLVGVWKMRSLRWPTLLLASPFLAVMLVLSVGSLKGAQSFQCRYLVPLISVFAIFFILGCLHISQKSHRPRWGSLPVILLALLNLPLIVLFPSYDYIHLNSWHQATQFLRSHQTEHTVIGVSTVITIYPLVYELDRAHLDIDFVGANKAPQVTYKPGYQGAPIVALDRAALPPQGWEALKHWHVLAILCQDQKQGADSAGYWLTQNLQLRELQEFHGINGWSTLQMLDLLPPK